MRWCVLSLGAVVMIGVATACSSSGQAVHGGPTGHAHVSRSPRPAAANVATTGAGASTTTVRCFHEKATITGTSGADRLVATRKGDVIVGLGGDDLVIGAGGQDSVCTGAGDDVVRSDRRRTWSLGVDLGAGNDRARLRSVDTIDGGPGADRIVIGHGPATVSGGPGADYLRAMSARWPGGTPENGLCVDYSAASRSVRLDLGRGWAHGEGSDRLVGFRCVIGSHHADVIRGSVQPDGIQSLGGDDVVHTGAGDDAVDAGNGTDRVYLGPGRDYGLGNMGWDRLFGGPGADDLEGWFGGDYLEGDAGGDQLYAALFCSHGGSSYDTDGLMDSAGNELFGGSGDDYLVGDRGNDRLDGGPGDDWGMGGYHDGRADWIASMEHLVDGCLPNVAAGKPFHPAG